MKNKPTYQALEKRVRELEKESVAWKEEKVTLQNRFTQSRALSDASFESIFLSENGVCLDQNQAAERMFGYTHDEAVGRPGTDWIVPEDREQVRNHMLSGYEKPYAAMALRKDGKTFPCEIQAQMMEFEGRPLRVTALRDLTESRQIEEALRESDRRFRELADNIREVFWVFDWRKQRMLYVNPAYEELWGRPVQALLENYKEWSDSIYPDDRDYAKDSFLRIVESGGGENREYRIVLPDGALRWVSDRGFAVYGNDGKVHRVVGIAEDITSQKDTEQKLRASEEKFSKAFYGSPDSIGISRMRDGQILEVNDGFIKATGFGRKELIGKSTTDLELWADPSDRQHFVKMMAEKGHVRDCEYRLRDKSGEVRDGLMSGEVIEIGPEKCLLVIVRDITDQKKAEKELQENQQRFQDMANYIREVFWIFDCKKQEVIYASPAMYDIWGRPSSERYDLYEEWRKSIHPDDLAYAEKSFAGIVENGGGEAWDYRIIRPDGTIRWMSSKGFAVKDDDGNTVRIVGIAQDITERKLTEDDLRESEEKFRTLIEESPLGIAIIGKDDRYTYLNPRFTDIFGYTIDDILTGREWFKKAYPDDDYRKHVMEIWIDDHSQAKIGQARPRSFTVTCKDGSEKRIHFRSVTMKTRDQFVIYEDITDRKRAETALQESEEKLRNIVEHSTNLFFSHTADHKITYISPQSRDFIQCDPEEAMTRWTEFITDSPLNEKGFASTEKAIATGKRQPIYELELVGKKGRKVWVEVNEAPVTKDDKTVAIVGSLTDITERKKAEKDLKKAHQTFLTVLDGIDATIYVADMDTYEILFMNQHMIDSFGSDLTGKICHEVFRLEKSPCSVCTNDQLLDANGHPNGVCTWETQNPITKKWYINYDRAIRWVDGRMVRLQIATDITKLKELEKERIQTEMQLRQAQKMESVGRLAGGVAHDFNNMLGVIIGHAELAMEQVAPSLPVHDDLKEIRTAARRSADLTRQLLAFARKQTILPKVLDLNRTVTGMLKMLGRLIGEDIELVWKPGSHLWPIKIDPAQIDQILANLCVNARDAINETGKLTIETNNIVMDQVSCTRFEGLVPGEYVTLVVSDDGCGMDKDTLDNLFEPFFTTKEVGEGTGLGLAMVYGIVKQNNAYIYVQSKPGEGSAFSVYFHRSLEDVTAKDKVEGQFLKKGVETVLLVEDEPSFLRLGKTVLERLGYVILAARTPSEALAMVERNKSSIHLLITDVVMPEMNGMELKTQIEKIIPDIKVLFMSGYTPDAAIHRGVLEEGMQFLPKPFSVSSLSSKVREILDA